MRPIAVAISTASSNVPAPITSTQINESRTGANGTSRGIDTASTHPASLTRLKAT